MIMYPDIHIIRLHCSVQISQASASTSCCLNNCIVITFVTYIFSIKQSCKLLKKRHHTNMGLSRLTRSDNLNIYMNVNIIIIPAFLPCTPCTPFCLFVPPNDWIIQHRIHPAFLSTYIFGNNKNFCHNLCERFCDL